MSYHWLLTQIFALAIDNKGNKWIGARDGLLVFNEGGVLSAEEKQKLNIPNSFILSQNYPNPFNPTTTISYSLEKDSEVSVNIYDISGKLISTLQNEYQTKGLHSIAWNGTDQHGLRVSAGIYFYQLRYEEQNITRKMLLLR